MCRHQTNRQDNKRRTTKNTQQHTTSKKNAKNKKEMHTRMLNYINQNGSKKYERNHKKNTNICNSCTHNRTFCTIHSFKSTKRCEIYYHKTEGLQLQNCPYHNSKKSFKLIIGW